MNGRHHTALPDHDALSRLARCDPQSFETLRLELIDLAKYGAYRGGHFSVAADETVYLGHFDIKCTAAGPKLWRVRAKPGEDFDAYLADLRKKYPFLDLKQTKYRLFQTTEFGHQYDQP